MARDELPFESATGFLLARLGSIAGRSWHGMLDQQGISPHEHAVLLALLNHRPLVQQDLGRMIAVDPRNLVAIVDSLEAKQFVRRSVDPDDRRRRLVDLTPKGRSAARALAAASAGIEAEFLGALSATEQRTLNRLLRKLQSAHMAR